MSSPTPHRFSDLLCEFGDILGWLIDHDPANFGRFLTAEDYEDYRSEHRRAVFYGKPPPLDENPTRTLLHWLQRGDLRAFDKLRNRWLSKKDWYGKDWRDVVRGIRRFVAKREDVLRLDQLKRDKEAAGAAVTADRPNAQTVPGNVLRQAPDHEIHKATTAVYDQAGASAPRSLSKPDSKQASLPKRQRGPATGTVNRFGEADLNLRSEFEKLIQGPRKMSRSAAALKLAQEGKLEGIGGSTAESRAKRLMRRFQKENAHH